MKKILKWGGIIIGVILVIGIIASIFSPDGKKNFEAGREAGLGQNANQNAETEKDQEAIDLVAGSITSNELNLDSAKLLTKDNPKGEGTFVYYPDTRFSGVERFVIWLVLDGKGYALNSPSKTAAPDLKWAREADEGVWEKTGLDKYQAAEAIEIVFTK